MDKFDWVRGESAVPVFHFVGLVASINVRPRSRKRGLTAVTERFHDRCCRLETDVETLLDNCLVQCSRYRFIKLLLRIVSGLVILLFQGLDTNTAFSVSGTDVCAHRINLQLSRWNQFLRVRPVEAADGDFRPAIVKPKFFVLVDYSNGRETDIGESLKDDFDSILGI